MSLKVFDLQCDSGHVFEGWFSAENSFEKQAERGLLSCPVCSSTEIERKLSAPRINLGKADAGTAGASTGAGDVRGGDGVRGAGSSAGQAGMAGGSQQVAEMQARMLRHMRELVKKSEDVGERFAQEARKIQSGEAKDRLIRGTASAEEQRELLDEGIMVMPVPDFLNDDSLQ